MRNINKYFYVSLTACAGLLNIISILVFVRKVDVHTSDLFLFSLAFVNFIVIFFSSPVNTGKLKFLFLKFESLEEEKQILAYRLYTSALKLLPLIFIVSILVLYMILNFTEFYYEGSKHEFIVLLSFYCVSVLCFEWMKIEIQIDKKFTLFALFFVIMSFSTLLAVVFYIDSLSDYLLFGIVIRTIFIIYDCYKRCIKQRFKEESIHDNYKIHKWEFVRSIQVYSLSVFFTGLSAFLPSYFLSFFPAGHLTAYQLAYRFITSPLALIVTPYVDYVRYSLSKASMNFKNYFINALLIVLVTSFLSIVVLCFSENIARFFLTDQQYIAIFTTTLSYIIFSMTSGAIYIFNTRLAELNFSIAKMSVTGMSIHSLYLVIALISAYIINFELFVLSRVLIDVLVFLPTSYYFLRKSHVVIKHK